MLKISRLETRFQEIVFLLTITFALSVAVGGVLYLHLATANFLNATGVTGSYFVRLGFSSLGYTYFFLVILALHMGHLVLATAHQVRDLGQNFSIYFRNIVIYTTILMLISSFLTVLEQYSHWQAAEQFFHGYGGLVGSLVGGLLYKNFGLFGALVLLFSAASVIGISAGYMEIVHSFYVMKDIFKEISRNLHIAVPAFFKVLGHIATDFLDKKPQFAHAGGAPREKRTFIESHRIYRAPALTEESVEQEEFVDDTQYEAQPENVSEYIEEIVEDTFVEEIKPEKPKTRAKAKLKVKYREEAPTLILEDDIKQEELEVAPVEDDENKSEVDIKLWTKRYKKLETSLLAKPDKRNSKNSNEMNKLCRTLAERLESFGIKGDVIDAHQGVTLTMFEFQPAAGMKLSKIQALSDDLALVLGAKSIRILTPIPGKSTVGIEVPNAKPSTIRFSEMVASCLKMKSMALPVPLGMDVYNNVHVQDLTQMPHLLVSGTTGSGKSVFMNSLISGLLFHKSPKDLRFLMIDPKMIELSPYNGIPHLLKPVVTDVEEAKNLLLWAEREMDKRYQIFADMQSKNLITFNAAVKKGSKRAIEGRLNRKIDWKFEEMPYIVIVIDELADLMLTQRNEVERPITRIAQKARAAGIHLVMATQRPSAEIVTGLIKTNFPTRVSFKVSSAIDSRTILDNPGAEKLLGNGDLLFMAQGKNIERMQGAFLSEEEVKKIVNAVTLQGK